MTMQQTRISVHPSLFRAYDIRGIVGKTLTEESVYAIGRVLGSLALEAGDRCMAVGRDGRLSGPPLASALCEGILATGCDVVDIGMVRMQLDEALAGGDGRGVVAVLEINVGQLDLRLLRNVLLAHLVS